MTNNDGPLKVTLVYPSQGLDHELSKYNQSHKEGDKILVDQETKLSGVVRQRKANG